MIVLVLIVTVLASAVALRRDPSRRAYAGSVVRSHRREPRSAARSRRPSEFRRQAAELVLAGRSVKDVAESLGCSGQSLYNWIKPHQLDRRERDDGLTSAEREGLHELRKRVKRLEQEHDILKRGDRDP